MSTVDGPFRSSAKLPSIWDLGERIGSFLRNAGRSTIKFFPRNFNEQGAGHIWLGPEHTDDTTSWARNWPRLQNRGKVFRLFFKL